MNKDKPDIAKSLLTELDKFAFLASVIISLLFTVGYFFLARWIPPKDTLWIILRDFLTALITNFIPVFLVFASSYVFLRRIQTIKAEKENEELAQKLAYIVGTNLSRELHTHLGSSAEVYFNEDDEENDSSLYKALTQAVLSAKDSVQVIGIYRSADIGDTPNRRYYYDEIKQFLESKRKSGEKFRFERIVQVSGNCDEVLRSNQVDNLHFEHCKYLLGLHTSKGNLQVRLRKILEGICPISFLIIDRKTVIFLIPSVVVDEKGGLKRHTQLGTLIILNDALGGVAQEVLRIFDRLFQESVGVQKASVSE